MKDTHLLEWRRKRTNHNANLPIEQDGNRIDDGEGDWNKLCFVGIACASSCLSVSSNKYLRYEIQQTHIPHQHKNPRELPKITSCYDPTQRLFILVGNTPWVNLPGESLLPTPDSTDAIPAVVLLASSSASLLPTATTTFHCYVSKFMNTSIVQELRVISNRLLKLNHRFVMHDIFFYSLSISQVCVSNALCAHTYILIMYASIRICVHVCMYVYTHMYTHIGVCTGCTFKTPEKATNSTWGYSGNPKRQRTQREGIQETRKSNELNVRVFRWQWFRHDLLWCFGSNDFPHLQNHTPFTFRQSGLLLGDCPDRIRETLLIHRVACPNGLISTVQKAIRVQPKQSSPSNKNNKVTTNIWKSSLNDKTSSLK